MGAHSLSSDPHAWHDAVGCAPESLFLTQYRRCLEVGKPADCRSSHQRDISHLPGLASLHKHGAGTALQGG